MGADTLDGVPLLSEVKYSGLHVGQRFGPFPSRSPRRSATACADPWASPGPAQALPAACCHC